VLLREPKPDRVDWSTLEEGTPVKIKLSGKAELHTGEFIRVLSDKLVAVRTNGRDWSSYKEDVIPCVETISQELDNETLPVTVGTKSPDKVLKDGMEIDWLPANHVPADEEKEAAYERAMRDVPPAEIQSPPQTALVPAVQPLEPIGETFQFSDKPLQVYGTPEEPWFRRNEVCKILRHTNPTEACRGLDADEMKGSGFLSPHSGVQQAVFLNESGLYALIVKSRTPEAKRFRKFVTSEVLPSIRKTGGYVQTGREEEFLNKEGGSLILNVRDPKSMVKSLTQLAQELERAEEEVRVEFGKRTHAEAKLQTSEDQRQLGPRQHWKMTIQWCQEL